MIEFIKTFYLNEQIIKLRGMRIVYIILLFILTVMLSSLPSIVGRYGTTLSQYQVLYPDADKVLIELSDKIKLSNGVMSLESFDTQLYGYHVLSADVIETNENRAIIIAPHQFYIANAQGQYTLGDYSTMGSLNFTAIKQDNAIAYQFIKNVDLGGFSVAMITIYFANFIQTLIYTLVVCLLLIIIKRSHNLKVDYSFKEVVAMIVMLMFACAFLVAILGMFLPGIAAVSLPLFFLIRFIRFYYKNFRQIFFA